LSASLSLVLIVTLACASTIGLIDCILLLNPGNNSTSDVSISPSFAVPEKIAALKLLSIAPKNNCPPDQKSVSNAILI